MPTILPPPRPPDFSGYPPHMSAEDFPIWNRYYPTIKARTIALYFDVGLGLPLQLPETSDPNLLLGWIRLNQKRADVIAELIDELLLIELRFNAQSNAIGRLLLYRRLLGQDNPTGKKITAVLVSNRYDHEVKELALEQSITYVIV